MSPLSQRQGQGAKYMMVNFIPNLKRWSFSAFAFPVDQQHERETSWLCPPQFWSSTFLFINSHPRSELSNGQWLCNYHRETHTEVTQSIGRNSKITHHPSRVATLSLAPACRRVSRRRTGACKCVPKPSSLSEGGARTTNQRTEGNHLETT